MKGGLRFDTLANELQVVLKVGQFDFHDGRIMGWYLVYCLKILLKCFPLY